MKIFRDFRSEVAQVGLAKYSPPLRNFKNTRVEHSVQSWVGPDGSAAETVPAVWVPSSFNMCDFPQKQICLAVCESNLDTLKKTKT